MTNITLLTTILILTMTTTSWTMEQIQLYDLENNPGLVVLQLGKGRIQIGSHKIFHVIDLEYLAPTIHRLKTIINGLNIFDVQDSVTLMNKKLGIIERLYKYISPIRRRKRGLFNGLGSIMKTITGNLDEDDLIKINIQLQELQHQNRDLISNNNEQIKINHKVQDRLNRIIEALNDQQRIIKSYFIKFRENSSNGRNVSNEIKIVKEIFNLNLNIDLLTNHVSNIFEAIQMSKAKIISKDILSIEELREASKILENENINIQNIEQVQEYLDLVVIHDHSKIVFIILIPLLRTDVYDHQLMEPIVKDGKLLNLQFLESLSTNSSTYLITGGCARIRENTICSEQHIKDVSRDTCYSKLLRGISGSCDLIEAVVETKVKRVSSNYVIITGDGSIPITSNCGLSNRNVSGSTLIFFRNCTITVNHTSFTDIEYVTKQQPVIIPLNGLEITSKSVSTNFTLKKLEEVSLQTRQQLQFLHNQQKVSTFGTSLAIIFVVIIFILHLFKDHLTCKPKSNHLYEPGRSVLQDGLVTERTRPFSNNQLDSSTIPKETSYVSIPPSLPTPGAPPVATTKPKTTTTTTIMRPTGTMQTADIARHPTPHIRT